MSFNLLKPFRKKFGSQKHYYRMLDDIFGIYPNNLELYKLALIHRSASVTLPGGNPINNERLEFLGDAVLESIVSDYLFIEFPDANEGFLTQLRSKIVSRQTLNELCVRLGLSEHIVSQAGGCIVQKHLNGDALEAIIGAIYLDKGYNFTNRLIINGILARHLDLEELIFTETDFKSRLIEWCQKNKHSIRFETKFCDDSSAQNPMFRSSAIIDDMELGYGLGNSKKEAEQRASFAVSQVLTEGEGDSFLEWVDERVQNGGVNGKKSKE